MFDSGTNVIDAGGDDFRPLQAGEKRWVLWPVWAFKVLVPEPRPRTFDVFQTAILRLCNAGLVRIEDIKDRLALDRDLVAFVVLQLQSIGLIDSNGRPSPRALKLLAHDEEPETTDVVGYVLEDALTRRIWPRFLTGKLPYARCEAGKGSVFEVIRGTPGNPRSIRARVLQSRREMSGGPPSAQSILRAARQHRARVKSFQLQIGAFGEAARAAPAGRGGGTTLVRRVQLVDRTPEPLFVATCIFVPKESREARVHVADPFGLGLSAELRAEVERLAQEGHRTLQGIVKELTKNALHVDSQELVELVREGAAQAVAKVRSAVGNGIDELPAAVLRHLVASEERLADAREQLEGARRDRGAGLKRIDDLMGFAFAAVEEIFGWMVRTFCGPELPAMLGRHAQANRKLLRKIACGIGFRLDDETSDGTLLTVSGGQVRGAIEFDNRALPARLSASVLAARGRPEHPLHRIAHAWPEAIAFLARLKRLRDDASHVTDAESGLRAAEEALTTVYRLLRTIVPPSSLTTAIENGESRVAEWNAELMGRLRGQALRLVEQATPDSLESPDLRVRIIDAQQKVLEIGHLVTGGAEAELIVTRLRDFAVAAGLVVEAGLAMVARAGGAAADPTAIPDDKRQLAHAVARAAEAAGFAVYRSTLPESLSFVRPDAVRRAVTGQDETQSARLAALLLAAARDDEHPMRRIARLHPELLDDCAKIADARGHGDEANLVAEETADVMSVVYRLVHTFMLVQ